MKQMNNISPPPLTPPTRYGEKRFLPLSPSLMGIKGAGRRFR